VTVNQSGSWAGEPGLRVDCSWGSSRGRDLVRSVGRVGLYQKREGRQHLAEHNGRDLGVVNESEY